MNNSITFNEITLDEEIRKFRKEWVKSLTIPQDGMWSSLRDSATQWALNYKDQLIGYASVNESNQLLQFYVAHEYVHKGPDLFQKFTKSNNITSAIVGTNNPIFLTIIMPFVKGLKVHSHLFRDYIEVDVIDKEGIIKRCKAEDLSRIVSFVHYSIRAPTKWLQGYLGDLISRNELYSLELEDTIVGTFEVRKSLSAAGYADIGMIASPDYRKQGYGTFLLYQAKMKALSLGLKPICSCEKENEGSYKSIIKCGFVSTFQLLLIDF